ncbi:hypothetical protein ABPG74_017988 [Tetrahymena malaccensis]
MFQSQQQLKNYVFKRYNEYLDFTSQSEKIIITFQFQKIALITQTLGKLTQNVMDNSFSYDQFVSWEDKLPEQYSQGQIKPNFLIVSGYQLKDYCIPIEYCNDDQTCLDSYDQYDLQLNYWKDQVQYEKSQYSTWTYQMANTWEYLSDLQKQFIIKVSIHQLFGLSYFLNQQEDMVQTYGIYLTRQEDGIFFEILSYNLLVDNSQLGIPEYGGPFTCEKINGSYPEYIYTNANQFDGFQYQDDSGNICGDSISPCQCSYFNIKRLTPEDWRCRPWYQQANDTFYVSFSQPYIDYYSSTVFTTSTFKVVLDTNITNIEEQIHYQQDAVFAVDIYLKQLQMRFNKSLQNFGYSYLISTNTNINASDFIPLVFAHPDMNFTLEQDIYDVEFTDPKFKQSEILQYKNQTEFLVTPQKLVNLCNLASSNDIQVRTITKNNVIYMFNCKINKGLIKSSKELKNLIFSINEIVLKVQENIQNTEKRVKQEKNEQMIEIYLKSLITYEAISHQNGVAMCLNNIAGIYLLQKNFEKALQFMSLSDKISNQILEEITQDVIKQDKVNQQQAIQILSAKDDFPFFKIYASRKYQLANILYYCAKSQFKSKSEFKNTLKSNIAGQLSRKSTRNETITNNLEFVKDSKIIRDLQLATSNNCFSLKFKEKLNYKNNQNADFIQTQRESLPEIYIQQAKDLIYEASVMFQLINELNFTEIFFESDIIL